MSFSITNDIHLKATVSMLSTVLIVSVIAVRIVAAIAQTSTIHENLSRPLMIIAGCGIGIPAASLLMITPAIVYRIVVIILRKL